MKKLGRKNWGGKRDRKKLFLNRKEDEIKN